MKNKRINLLLILCFSLIFFITSFDCAYAAEENGSLNIILTYERQAIDGAEFSVYQVAKWNEKESRHTVKAPFRWNGDFVNIKTADDQLKLSLYFEKQSRNIKEMMKGETGDDGTAKFTDLKDGIYLVVQTGSSGKAKDFTNVQPFLVIIPQFENGIQNSSADEGGSCGCGGQSYFQLSADIRKVRIPPAGGGGSGCGNGAFALYGNGDRRNMGAYP